MQIDVNIRKKLRSGPRTFDLEVAFQTTARRVVIFGPSGAGKSLTLKAIAGLVTPDHGHIRISGATVFDAAAGVCVTPQQRQLAYVFQDYALFPHLNVRQNVGFGLAHGWWNPGTNQHNTDVEYWLAAFDLLPVAHQLPAELSGGQRQRTALARALVSRPRLLLLDEPFAAIDGSLRQRMRLELGHLQRRLDFPMITITHDPEDVEMFGELVIHLLDGKVCFPTDKDAESARLFEFTKPQSSAAP